MQDMILHSFSDSVEALQQRRHNTGANVLVTVPFVTGNIPRQYIKRTCNVHMTMTPFLDGACLV